MSRQRKQSNQIFQETDIKICICRAPFVTGMHNDMHNVTGGSANGCTTTRPLQREEGKEELYDELATAA
jgi:hypothetical protein